MACVDVARAEALTEALSLRPPFRADQASGQTSGRAGDMLASWALLRSPKQRRTAFCTLFYQPYKKQAAVALTVLAFRRAPFPKCETTTHAASDGPPIG